MRPNTQATQMKNSMLLLMMATLSLLMLLAGCSDSPYQPGSVSPAELKSIQAGRKLFPRKCRDILENGEEFTLYSLDPSAKTNANPANNFYNYSILGKVQIKDPKERQALLNALYGGMDMDGRQSKCFEPRHGIRAKKGDQVADLVICFQCRGIYLSASEEQLSVTQTPAPTFNRILTAAQIPLAK
jgi:hypothetical protein